MYKRQAKDNFLQRPFRKPTDFYNPKSLIAGFRLHTLGDAYSSVSRLSLIHIFYPYRKRFFPLDWAVLPPSEGVSGP